MKPNDFRRGYHALPLLLLLASGLGGGLRAYGQAAPPSNSSDQRIPTNSSDQRIAPQARQFTPSPGQLNMERQYQEFENHYGARSIEKQSAYWSGLNLSSALAYAKSLEPYRSDLVRAVGVPDDLQARQPVRLAASRRISVVDGVSIYRWRLEIGDTGLQQVALVGISNERRSPYSVVVGFYDSTGSPEAAFGLTSRRDYRTAFGLSLAKAGYLVFVPWQITDKETAYQADKDSMGLGMRLVGVEVGLAMRSMDYLAKRPDVNPRKIAAYGVGIGGVLATYLGACDPRINATANLGGFLNMNTSATRYQGLEGSLYLSLSRGQTLFLPEILPRLIAPRPLFIGYGFDRRFKKNPDESGVRVVYDRLEVPTLIEMRPLDSGARDYVKPSLDFLRRVSPPSPLPNRTRFNRLPQTP